jgi:hypothetical protein
MGPVPPLTGIEQKANMVTHDQGGANETWTMVPMGPRHV